MEQLTTDSCAERPLLGQWIDRSRPDMTAAQLDTESSESSVDGSEEPR
jgi:hypothetical protein